MRLPKPRFRKPSLYGVITALVVGTSSLFVLSQLRPDLIAMDSVAAGGDMGAHVWAPHALVDHLLPHGRLTGWSPDWYAGFPALHFYFPLPMVLIALLDVILPAGVAFKVVTVSGLVTLPIAVWAFGRLAGLPFPIPASMAAFTLPFLFNDGFSILGGNIASTLAGEFAFSVSLSLAFVFLGLVANGVRTGKHRASASVLCAAVIMSHVLPTILSLVAGILLVVIAMVSNIPKGRRAVLQPIIWSLPVAAVGGLLSAWWLLPFIWQRDYMNDMGWEKIGTGVESGMKLFGETIVNYRDALQPEAMKWWLVFAVISFAVSLLFRRRIGIFLGLIAVIAAIGFVYAPQGQLWNARLLPFWYLSLYLLVGYLIGEIGYGISRLVNFWVARSRLEQAADGAGTSSGLKEAVDEVGTPQPQNDREEVLVDVGEGVRITAPLVGLAISLAMVMPLLAAPNWWPDSLNKFWYDPSEGGSPSFISGWAEWNYSGYDGKRDNGEYYKPAHPEYLRVMDMLETAGADQGCGRVMWEYEPELDRFGTPMGLMLSPLYTDGCMGSMEGLYFESSPTVPYHFLNQRELSATPSSPMRDIPYAPGIDVPSGVTKLQQLGVKYYLAVSPQAQQGAAQDQRLSLVASVPAAESETGDARTWNLYEIEDSEIVEPLEVLPNVMTDWENIETWREGNTGEEHTTREAWLENGIAAYTNPLDFDIPRAIDGPDDWPRVEDATEVPRRQVIDDPAEVTFTAMGDDRISFRVDEPGKPVLVKASYFPNWQAEGAEGPYRVTPNLMVVIPTSTEVSLHYGRTPVDIASAGMGVLGLVAVVWMWRRPDPNPEPSKGEHAEAN